MFLKHIHYNEYKIVFKSLRHKKREDILFFFLKYKIDKSENLIYVNSVSDI